MIPPSQTYQQPAGDVLDHPKVEGCEYRDNDKRGDVFACDVAAPEVDANAGYLEDGVKHTCYRMGSSLQVVNHHERRRPFGAVRWRRCIRNVKAATHALSALSM